VGQISLGRDDIFSRSILRFCFLLRLICWYNPFLYIRETLGGIKPTLTVLKSFCTRQEVLIPRDNMIDKLPILHYLVNGLDSWLTVTALRNHNWASLSYTGPAGKGDSISRRIYMKAVGCCGQMHGSHLYFDVSGWNGKVFWVHDNYDDTEWCCWLTTGLTDDTIASKSSVVVVQAIVMSGGFRGNWHNAVVECGFATIESRFN
jgi:hypothetical protein